VSLYNKELQLQWHVRQGKKGRKKNRIGYIDKNKRLDKSVLHGSCNLYWTLEDVAIQTLKPIFSRLIPMLLQRKASIITERPVSFDLLHLCTQVKR